MSRRMESVNAVVRQEISRVLPELNDPRLASLISVTEVRVARDLRSAKVFFSVLGDADAKRGALDAMQSAGGFIHRAMKRNLKLKYAPVLSFQLDESIEKGAEMMDLISRNAPAAPPSYDGGGSGATAREDREDNGG